MEPTRDLLPCHLAFRGVIIIFKIGVYEAQSGKKSAYFEK